MVYQPAPLLRPKSILSRKRKSEEPELAVTPTGTPLDINSFTSLLLTGDRRKKSKKRVQFTSEPPQVTAAAGRTLEELMRQRQSGQAPVYSLSMAEYEDDTLEEDEPKPLERQQTGPPPKTSFMAYMHQTEQDLQAEVQAPAQQQQQQQQQPPPPPPPPVAVTITAPIQEPPPPNPSTGEDDENEVIEALEDSGFKNVKVDSVLHHGKTQVGPPPISFGSTYGETPGDAFRNILQSQATGSGTASPSPGDAFRDTLRSQVTGNNNTLQPSDAGGQLQPTNSGSYGQQPNQGQSFKPTLARTPTGFPSTSFTGYTSYGDGSANSSYTPSPSSTPQPQSQPAATTNYAGLSGVFSTPHTQQAYQGQQQQQQQQPYQPQPYQPQQQQQPQSSQSQSYQGQQQHSINSVYNLMVPGVSRSQSVSPTPTSFGNTGYTASGRRVPPPPPPPRNKSASPQPPPVSFQREAPVPPPPRRGSTALQSTPPQTSFNGNGYSNTQGSPDLLADLRALQVEVDKLSGVSR